MTRPIGIGVSALLVGVALFGCHRDTQPKTSEGCIAQALANRKYSNLELVVLKQTCEAMFPGPHGKALSQKEVAQLTGRAGLAQAPLGEQSGTFTGTIYNPTTWTITAVEIAIWPHHDADPNNPLGDLWNSRTYRVEGLRIPPKTASGFSVVILPTDEPKMDWRLEGAEGVPAR